MRNSSVSSFSSMSSTSSASSSRRSSMDSIESMTLPMDREVTVYYKSDSYYLPIKTRQSRPSIKRTPTPGPTSRKTLKNLFHKRE